MTGRKNDSGKLDLTLVSLAVMEAVARAKTYGAHKYERDNYKQPGLSDQRLVASMLRHITLLMEGHIFDDESGLHHIDHIAACVDMYADLMKRGTLSYTLPQIPNQFAPYRPELSHQHSSVVEIIEAAIEARSEFDSSRVVAIVQGESK